MKQIADTFKKSCEEFCVDKGVKKSMSVAEKLRLEGIEEELQLGIRQTVAKLTELINAGLSIEEALNEVSNGTA